MNPSS